MIDHAIKEVIISIHFVFQIPRSRLDFDFYIVIFPFLDGDVPRSASYGVYISQLIRFARVSSHVDWFSPLIATAYRDR